MRILGFLLVIVFLFGCSEKRNKVMPADFGFICYMGSGNTLNTFDSVFTRSIFGRDSTMKIVFTKSEMQQIYDSLSRNNFWNMPDRLPVHYDENSSYEPLFLQVKNSGEQKKVKFGFHFADPYKAEPQLEQIERIYITIQNILKSKPAYKQIETHHIL